MHLAAQSAGPGDTVHSVGNSGVLEGALWRYTAGKVRSVYQAEIRTEDGLLKARIIESQSPINGGDSGGPLVNDRGELVGVVTSTQKQTRLVSFNVDVHEVKAFLGDAFWNEVKAFWGDAFGPKARPSAGTPGAGRESAAVRGLWKLTLITLGGEQLPGGVPLRGRRDLRADGPGRGRAADSPGPVQLRQRRAADGRRPLRGPPDATLGEGPPVHAPRRVTPYPPLSGSRDADLRPAARRRGGHGATPPGSRRDRALAPNN